MQYLFCIFLNFFYFYQHNSVVGGRYWHYIIIFLIKKGCYACFLRLKTTAFIYFYPCLLGAHDECALKRVCSVS